MINYQPTQITKDRLLDLKVGESGYIIVPIQQQETLNHLDKISKNKRYSDNAFTELYSPLQQGDKFYLGENTFLESDCIYNRLAVSADQMQPEQSQSWGDVLSVEVVRTDEMDFDKALTFYPYETCDEDGLDIYEHLGTLVEDMEDYVFLITLRRNK